MTQWFDDSHVTDIGLRGSVGPAVSAWDMVQQGFRQQYRVDSALALESELMTRWAQSVGNLNATGQNFNIPSDSRMYTRFAEFARGGAPVTADEDDMSSFRTGAPSLSRQFADMQRANEAIRQLNNPNIRTFEQILEEVSSMQRGVEEQTASMSERSGWGGMVGEFLGAAAGSFSLRDPLNVVTAPIGFGRSIATRIASDIGIAAGLTAVTEYANVQPNRALAELPERNPLFNIAAAGLGAGVIRGGIEGIGAGVRRLQPNVEEIDFDLRDAQLQQMFADNSQSPTARAGASILDDAQFIERNNPLGEGFAANERFIAELRGVQRAMNGEPMTAIGRVLPPVPFEFIQKAADFEIVREQAPLIYARMEQAQAQVTSLRKGNTSFEQVTASNIREGTNVIKFIRGNIEGELIWKNGETEAGININGEGIGTSDITELRAGLADIKEAFPELETVRGIRMSGARQKAPQEVRVSLERSSSKERRAANAEYQTAYHAVETEAVRLREAQTLVEAAQQNEASNILAKVSEGRSFLGPLLRYDAVESLVERINKTYEGMDETSAAAFVRQTDEEGVTRIAWMREDGRIDIGLREPVEAEFRVVTEDGNEMSVVDAMRDLQDDIDLVEAVRSCSI